MRPSIRPRALAALVALAAVACLAPAPVRAQADGEPDPTFFHDGIYSNGPEPLVGYVPRALAARSGLGVAIVGDLPQSEGVDHLIVHEVGQTVALCEKGIFTLSTFAGHAMRLRNRFVFADGFEIGTTSFWRR